MPKCIAIIPARSGSKRIPRKNIKLFCGQPILAYSITAALKSGLFTRVMVSTDDESFADIARQHGAEVPFLRSSETARDEANLVDVVLEVLDAFKSQGESFDYYCCILPTAPFVSAEDLQRSYGQLQSSTADSLLSVGRFSSPIWRAFRRNCDQVEMIWPENIHRHSQELEPTFHDAGQFYWGLVDSIADQKKLFGTKCLGYELSLAQVQDIDTDEDWVAAELKYKLLAGR